MEIFAFFSLVRGDVKKTFRLAVVPPGERSQDSAARTRKVGAATNIRGKGELGGIEGHHLELQETARVSHVNHLLQRAPAEAADVLGEGHCHGCTVSLVY